MTTTQNDTYKTRVCFRAFPDGDIIALFPDEITDCIRHFCTSYQHIGQHSDASYDLIHSLRHADPTEYAELYAELTAIGYDLEIDDRYPIGYDPNNDPVAFYLYAGYYEHYLTTEPMNAPYVLELETNDIDEAMDYADETGDTIIYCDTVRDYLPNWLYDCLTEDGYEFHHYDRLAAEPTINDFY